MTKLYSIVKTGIVVEKESSNIKGIDIGLGL